jgi:hypothetical protein
MYFGVERRGFWIILQKEELSSGTFLHSHGLNYHSITPAADLRGGRAALSSREAPYHEWVVLIVSI